MCVCVYVQYICIHGVFCRSQYDCACAHREARTKLQDMGEAVYEFFGTYYEDHIQPVKDSYAEWASGIKGVMWDRIQTTIINYLPKKAN